ncbi:hypothetical protein AB0E08_07670 [Streptomyces sp. NPDC048281]|uniref:hypothetical protein n=1 Tax=Streptomyces sp. NPDC048281 TaxID=3154715 RepID=UPI0034465B96
MRFSIGAIVGALGAAVAHHAGQSMSISYLVGVGLMVCVWCRLTDALWYLIGTVWDWATSGDAS